MSALAEEHVPSEVARHPLIQLQRSVVKRNAFGSSVIRSQNRRVTATGSGPQVVLIEKSDLANTMFFAEIIGSSEPVHARTNDYDIVAGAQIVTPPHSAFTEQLHGSTSAEGPTPPSRRVGDETRAQRERWTPTPIRHTPG